MRIRVFATAARNFLSDIDVWFFFGFLITLPLSIRKVMWYSPLRGSFNEYADVSLYASDIFLILTVIFWIVQEYNNKGILSMYQKCFTWNIFRKQLAKVFVVILPVGLIFWSIVSLFNTINLAIGLFFVCKLIEFFILYMFVIVRVVPRETTSTIAPAITLRKILIIIISIGFVESIVGILQFLQQHSLGLSILKESIIDPILPGVAKVVMNNVQYIRAYGTFSHPNILGGFLLTSIILSHLYFKMFHVKHKQFELKQLCILLVQYTGIGLTFSKSAIIGLALSLVCIRFVSRGTLKNRQSIRSQWNLLIKKLFHVKQTIFPMILIGVISVLLFVIFSKINVDKLLFQSLREREVYQSIALTVIKNHPVLGISCGQLVIFMSQQSIYPLFDWQLQPVHNVFLLIWAEIGGIGFFLFTLWYMLLISLLFQKRYSKTEESRVGMYWHALLIGFLPILLFDHYFWDIQQGQLLFWLVTGLASGNILQHKSNYKTRISTSTKLT